MKKTPTNHPEINTSSLSDSFAEHPVVLWVSENGRSLLWVLALVLAVAFFLYRMFGASSFNAELDYLSAEKEFITFQNGVNHKDDAAAQTALDNLKSILKKHPEIQAKYDGLIAQSLINANNIQEAVLFADRTFERVKSENLPFYIDFAKNTLTIGQKKYEDALKQALQLKQQMLDNAHVSANNPELKAFGNILYAFNLLRIAILSQQLGDNGRELATWQEFQSIKPPADISGYSVTNEALEAVNLSFSEGAINLQSYIQMRMKTLK